MACRPTDRVIVLAAACFGRDWLAADEIRGQLQVFGFEDLTAQKIASRLGAMTREDAPRFESEDRWSSGVLSYRLTRFAETEMIFNTMRGIRLREVPR